MLLGAAPGRGAVGTIGDARPSAIATAPKRLGPTAASSQPPGHRYEADESLRQELLTREAFPFGCLFKALSLPH